MASKKSVQEAIEVLISVGCQMSNICFNLSQNRDNPHSRVMRESFRLWEAAVTKYRSERTAKRGRGEDGRH